MKAPKIKFTNIKTFEGLEYKGYNADVYIDGMKCLKIINDGSGNDLGLRKLAEHSNTINNKIDVLQEYVKTLPPKKISTYEIPMTMEIYLEDLLIEQQIQIENKRFENLQKTAILFGKPNTGRYMKLQFKTPLKNIPNNTLQKHIDNVIENYCKNRNYQILNTNLDGFNISV
ncbi:MAG: hypothetical protein ACOC2U_03990 [bacterium]